ncbi:MAG: methyltransferase family protein [Planctomycetota bacterium]|jgi:protein-S-isoprenylcysteine O-methyltransferase Ste14
MTGFGGVLFKFRGILPVPGVVLLVWMTSPNWGAAKVLPLWPEGRLGPILFLVGLAVAFLGQFIRISALRAIGPKSRVSSKIRTEELITTGVYSVVRNPLYTGNLFMAVGLSLATGWWPIAVICAVIGLVYYHFIIGAEENALGGTFGEQYAEYTARTPRLIPAPHKFKPLTEERRHRFGEYFPREINTVVGLLWCAALVGRAYIGPDLAGLPW